MNTFEEIFQKYKKSITSGNKKLITKLITELHTTSKLNGDFEYWIHEHLEKHIEEGIKIHHKFLVDDILPFLTSNIQNPNSIYLLAKLSRCHKLPFEFDCLKNLYKSILENKDDDRYKQMYREILLEWIEYSTHEWPSGLLYGNNGMTMDECNECLKDSIFWLSLENEDIYKTKIENFIQKITIWKNSLI